MTACLAPRAVLAALILLTLPCLTWSAPPGTAEPPLVELFAAIDAELVDVEVIPRDAKQLMFLLTNRTDQPLTVHVPAAFAATPVLAQFQPGGNLNNANNLNGLGAGAGGGGNQALGVGVNGGQDPNAGLFNGGGGGDQFDLQGGGLFLVPPDKTIKRRLPAVCLEHGKDEPRPRIAYEIQPLERVADAEGLSSVLAQLGQGTCSQRVAQLVAWHLASDLSWQELAELEIEHLNGPNELQFTSEEIDAAHRLLVAVQAAPGTSHPAGESLSSRTPR